MEVSMWSWFLVGHQMIPSDAGDIYGAMKRAVSGMDLQWNPGAKRRVARATDEEPKSVGCKNRNRRAEARFQ
jgi:hypothetical protein